MRITSRILPALLLITFAAPAAVQARPRAVDRTARDGLKAAGKVRTRTTRPPRQGVWVKLGNRMRKIPIKAAEKKFGIKWLRLQTLGKNLKERDLPGYSDGPGSFDINNLDAPQWVAPQYRPSARDRRAMGGRTARLYIGKVSGAVGHGLFARGTIRAGSVIGEYAGEVRMQHKEKDHKNGYTFTYDPFNHFPFIVDAQGQGNYMRFANHSAKTPNATPRLVYDEPHRRWHVLLVAKKDIKKGQQVLFNYGHQYDWSRFGIQTPKDLTP